ncbi:MAG: hypothetical protein CMJ75_18735 [Planctomycetaceae bacterium]|nr:hypothetical protein [Planctomycetaceae bacterium]
MPKVYIVQEPIDFDRSERVERKRFDTTPAEEFGEVVNLLSYRAKPYVPARVIAELREKLAGFAEDDYLLPSGSIAINMWAYAIASENISPKNPKLLQWSGQLDRYVELLAEIL